jgi:hypothetical protein
MASRGPVPVQMPPALLVLTPGERRAEELVSQQVSGVGS